MVAGRFMLTPTCRPPEKGDPPLPADPDHRAHSSASTTWAPRPDAPPTAWHDEDRLEIHPVDAESRHPREGDWVGIASRAGETSVARDGDGAGPARVVYTFHSPNPTT